MVFYIYAETCVLSVGMTSIVLTSKPEPVTACHKVNLKRDGNSFQDFVSDDTSDERITSN